MNTFTIPNSNSFMNQTNARKVAKATGLPVVILAPSKKVGEFIIEATETYSPTAKKWKRRDEPTRVIPMQEANA